MGLHSSRELLGDKRNMRLLESLQANPRASVAELARDVGLSAPTVRERLARLEDAGVIRGYRLDLDPVALGWPLMAYVRVKPMPGQLKKIADLAAAIPQVAECHRVTGEDCFVMKVYLASVDTLDQVLDRFLVHGQTTTSLVQSTPVPLRAPPMSTGSKPAKVIRGNAQASRGSGPSN